MDLAEAPAVLLAFRVELEVVDIVDLELVLALMLQDLASGFESIHDGHIDIHEDEPVAARNPVSSVRPRLLMAPWAVHREVSVLLEHVHCLLAVVCLVHCDAVVFLQQHFHRKKVKRVVIDDEDAGGDTFFNQACLRDLG